MKSGEKHHIKPRSLFPELTKDKSNIVKLTYREHYICHWLLTKIYPSKEMTYAFWLFNSWNKNKGHINTYAYAKSRAIISDMMSAWNKQRIFSEETKMKLSEASKGKHLSEEAKKKISEVHKGKKLSFEAKKKLIEARKGRAPMKGQHHSEETKKKMSEIRIGLVFWNDGIINKMSRECPGEGWVRGRLKK